MSTSFTTPGNATWQTLLDELTLAYSERRQAISQAAYDAIDDRDVQAASYWTALQSWLETNCLNYIDHVSGPLTADGKDFKKFTLATWRSAAGLNASGFRRATAWDGITDPTWSYGQMQVGDIIGPWVFEDLQKGLGALKWVSYFPNLASLKIAFPADITGAATLTASGSGPNWKGIYYASTVDDSGILGSGGTYNLSLDSRENWNQWGGDPTRSFIGMGQWWGCLEVQMDCAGDPGGRSYNYAYNLVFSDASVFVAGINWYYSIASIKSATASNQTVTASATLNESLPPENPGEYAMFFTYPYCKCPFTNA